MTQDKPIPSQALPPGPAREADEAELALADEGGGKAMPFEQVRAARRAELTEDYLELIADLIDESGEARATDLSRRMGVSHATVIKIIGRLKREGLVNSQPYRSIFLTEAGRRIAEESKRKHDIVLRFLLALGVSPAQADIDSEGMEHHVSDETLALFESFIRKNEAGKG
ncbi:manganese-binding transcriptional regulator MntR [Radicibacter daui]|uniref:manganese-binding transcriptional regulator MntR n=1 Tax=Radicibacter daui TaxID=3064829 RepID=UPI004046E46F